MSQGQVSAIFQLEDEEKPRVHSHIEIHGSFLSCVREDDSIEVRLSKATAALLLLSGRLSPAHHHVVVLKAYLRQLRRTYAPAAIDQTKP